MATLWITRKSDDPIEAGTSSFSDFEFALHKSRHLLGRRKHCDVRLDHPIISGEHASITEREPGIHWLQDEDSTNGTMLNGKPVNAATLANDDVIKIGPYTLRYCAAAVVTVAASLPALIATPAPMLSQHPALPDASLVILSTQGQGQRLALSKPVVTVGKLGSTVASISKRPFGYAVSHLGGGEPTKLNGAAIDQTPVYLQGGDRLLVDGIEMEFVIHPTSK